MGGEKTTTITSSPLVISIGGHFDPISGTLKTAHNETDYAFNKSVITDLQKKEEGCPNEIAIIVHGFGLMKLRLKKDLRADCTV